MLNILVCVIILFMFIVGFGLEVFQLIYCQFWFSFRLKFVNEFVFLILFLCFGFCNILLIISFVVINLCCKSLIKKRICIIFVNDWNVDVWWYVIGLKVFSGNILVFVVFVLVLIIWVLIMVWYVIYCNVYFELYDIFVSKLFMNVFYCYICLFCLR